MDFDFPDTVTHRAAASGRRAAEVSARLERLRTREPLSAEDVDVARGWAEDARGRLDTARWGQRQSRGATAGRLRALAQMCDDQGQPERARTHISWVQELEESAASDPLLAELRLGDAVGTRSWLDDPQSGDGPPPAAWGEEGHVHEALFFSSTRELVDSAAPPLLHALGRGELVVLSCTEPNNRALADAMGEHRNLVFLPRPLGYRSAVTAFAYYREVVRAGLRAGVPRVRLVAQPGFDVGTRGWDEWRHFEALCNELLTAFAVSQVCAYDRETVPEAVAATAELSHPYVRDSGLRAPNRLYVDPQELLRLPGPKDDPVGLEPDLCLFDVLNPAEVQTRVDALLRKRSMSTRSVEDLLWALHEVVATLVTLACGPVDVRVWLPPRRVVCLVSPQSPDALDASDLAGEFELFALDRLGLRVARGLCDELVPVRDPERFSIRLTKRR